MPIKTSEPLEGIVEFFNRTKRWGLIKNGEDKYFVHFSNINNKERVLYQGQEVLFDLVKTVKGLMAVNVRVKD